MPEERPSLNSIVTLGKVMLMLDLDLFYSLCARTAVTQFSSQVGWKHSLSPCHSRSFSLSLSLLVAFSLCHFSLSLSFSLSVAVSLSLSVTFSVSLLLSLSQPVCCVCVCLSLFLPLSVFSIFTFLCWNCMSLC